MPQEVVLQTSSQLWKNLQAFYEVLHANKIFTSGAFPHVESGLFGAATDPLCPASSIVKIDSIF
jgi:hypothetical protein